MSGILVLVLRVLLALALYGFLGYILYTIWHDLRATSSLLKTRIIPAITLSVTNTLEDQTQAFAIPEILIGRSSSCTYIIRNDTVSSNHARMSYHHDQWWVEDLKSTNGTFINDERIHTPTVIINGDDLRCGQVSVKINLEENK